MRSNIGPFGLKDFFTLINLAGGVVAVHFLFQGRPTAAGIAILAGYFLGDALDGPVARMTGTANRFGSELDTATDHFVQAVVPALIVYDVYAQGGHAITGMLLMAAIVGCATIRQALFTVAKLGDPLIWCGLPRTVSGFGAMAYVLSQAFFVRNPARYWIGDVVITALAVLNLAPVPYMTHRGRRRIQTYVRFLILGFMVTTVAALFISRDYVFDILFFWMAGYAAAAWFPIYPEEKRAFYARYREWAKEVTAAK